MYMDIVLCVLWVKNILTGEIVTGDNWHMTHGVVLLSKFQLSCSNALHVIMFQRSERKASGIESMNEIITKVFIKQPRLHRVS